VKGIALTQIHWLDLIYVFFKAEIEGWLLFPIVQFSPDPNFHDPGVPFLTPTARG
jgi:hypothetical protein